MRFSSQTVYGLFNAKIQFTIPVYQRAYSWTQNNWRVLIDDLREQADRENNYSFGNLLLETIVQDSKYEIIDGQQRVTTLILMMRSLIDALRAKGYPEDDLGELEDDFIIRHGLIKLLPVDYDRACFKAIVVEKKSYEPSKESQVNMCKAIEFFSKEFEQMDLDILVKVKDTVLGSTVNRLEMEGKAEAALMFELQNNRGKDLTNLEKLKSFLMYEMYVNSPKESTEYNIGLISDYFKDIYNVLFHIKNLDEDRILVYHCNAYLPVAFAYKNLDNIKREFKEADDKVKWINEFTSELRTTYNNLSTLHLMESTYYRKLQKMKRRSALSYFIYPFIIKGLKYLGIDSAKMDPLFHLMEILAFRYELINSRADIDSRLSSILRSFDGDLVALRDKLSVQLNDTYYWGDNKMRSVLSGDMYGNSMLNYLLWEYEDSLQPKGYVIGSLEIESEQIEHISPRTPPECSDSPSGYEVDEDNHYSEAFIRDELNCIGNLTLISGSHNATIRNNSFAVKLASYNDVNLLKQETEIQSFVDTDPAEWKTRQIEKRKEKILSFAVNRWRFESVKI